MILENIATYIYAGLGGLFLLLFFTFLLFSRKKSKKPEICTKFPENTASVFKALDAFYRNDRQAALSWLKKAARFFPGELSIFVLIGDMIKEKRPDKALSLHQSLLFRKGLSDYEKSRIYYHIGQDRLASGNKKQALEALKQSDSFHPDCGVLEKIISLDVEMESFEDACRDMKILNKRNGAGRYNGLTDISLKAADFFISSRNPESSHSWIKRYEKYTADKSGALLLRMKTEIEANFEKNAVKTGKKIMKNFPEEEVTLRFFLSQKSSTKNINSFIPGPLSHPFDVVFTSAEVEQDDFEVVNSNTSLFYRLFAAGDIDGKASELIKKAADSKGLFVCSNCGFTRKDSLLLCPGCLSDFRVSLQILYGG